MDMHTGEHVAVKFVARGDGFPQQSITRELFNQRLCSGHPHIVQILVRGFQSRWNCPSDCFQTPYSTPS